MNVNVGLCSTASVSSCRLCDPLGFLERRAIPWGFSNVNGHIMEPRQALRMRMRPIFAIVCCVRSNPKQLTWKDTSLYRTLMPSLDVTLTAQEREHWDVRLYLCADEDDIVFKGSEAEIARSSPGSVGVRWVFVPKVVSSRVPSREAAEQARLDGAEYFHRTNDDIRYLSPGWLTSSVRALRNFDPPNIGIAGPKVYGDGAVNKMHGGVTIDVVHRTHLRIFREYYPQQLDNWYTDSWIVYAYVHTLDERRRVAKLQRGDNFSVMHAFERRRYTPAKTQLRLLPALAECGRHAIAAFINATRHSPRNQLPRHVSCRAYETLPREVVAGRHCSHRADLIGGLEMHATDVQKSARNVAGFCRSTNTYRDSRAAIASALTFLKSANQNLCL